MVWAANIYYDDNYGAELESEVRTWESFLVSSDSILFTEDVNTKSCFLALSLVQQYVFLKYPALLRSRQMKNRIILCCFHYH